MTEEEPSAPPPRTPSARERQIYEIIGWVFSPLLLVAATGIIALVLGAPWMRVTLVFALLAIGIGGYLLYRPSNRIPFGKVRLASLIYSGLGAIFLSLAIASVGAGQTQTASRALGAASRPPSNSVSTPPTPERRSFFPWAYTVSPLTLTCQESPAFGQGDVIATTGDGRIFAVNEEAVSEERPSIQSLERSDGTREELQQAGANLAVAGRGLCQGPERVGLSIIASAGEPPPPPPPPPSPWSYSSTTDEMTDRRTSHACTMSTNVVRLGWPYETQRVSLCIRQHPRWGQDVIVRLERGGQFLCTSYQACTVRVRFGDGEAAGYSALGPADNSADTIFISNDARFIGNLRRSSRVIIEANFYQAGAQQMSFDTGQFEWPPRS